MPIPKLAALFQRLRTSLTKPDHAFLYAISPYIFHKASGQFKYPEQRYRFERNVDNVIVHAIIMDATMTFKLQRELITQALHVTLQSITLHDKCSSLYGTQTCGHRVPDKMLSLHEFKDALRKHEAYQHYYDHELALAYENYHYIMRLVLGLSKNMPYFVTPPYTRSYLHG